MIDALLPAEWSHVAELPLSELAPRRVLADAWEEAGDPAGPALRQLCDVLDGRLAPEAVDAWPSALHRAAPALFPARPPQSAWSLAARALIRPFRWVNRLTPEQERLLPVWQAVWRRVALATGPTDEGSARPAVDAAYAACGVAPPAAVVWADSPGAVYASHWTGEPHPSEVIRWACISAEQSAGAWLRGPRAVPPGWDVACDGHKLFREVYYSVWPVHPPAVYSFWYAVAGLRDLAHLAGHWRLAELTAGWWPFRDRAVLIRRPTELVVRNGRVARMVYADGFAFDFAAPGPG